MKSAPELCLPFGQLSTGSYSCKFHRMKMGPAAYTLQAETSRRKDHVTSSGASTECSNCGQAAGPRFCPRCGQELRSRRGPLFEVLNEVLDELSLDNKLFRSLRTLFRPGRLTELYVDGKRVPYLRPFRFYLLASVILFSTALTFEAPDATGLEIRIGGERAGPAAEGNLKRSLDLLDTSQAVGRWQASLAGDRLERFRSLPKQEILDRLAAGWRQMLPSAMILFVPFLALGLKLLYIRGKAARTLYLDHLVFALHFQVALFLFVSLAWLVARLAGGGLGAQVVAYMVTALVMLLVYMPLSLYRFYRQSPFWTAFKTIALTGIYAQLLGLLIKFSALITIYRTP